MRLANRLKHGSALVASSGIEGHSASGGGTVSGRLVRSVGLTLEAVGCELPTGTRCEIDSAAGPVKAEVVGFQGERTILMPLDPTVGLCIGDAVRCDAASTAQCDAQQLLGRVIDGLGAPLDGRPLAIRPQADQHPASVNPLQRTPLTEPLDVGVRAINGLLTLGRGQRVGLMAGSGVGKSVLLGMMARFTDVDVAVVALIGERGREVREFLEDNLGEAGLARSVVIAAAADAPPLVRRNAAYLATTIAESFRNQGRHVLLMMDSLTRFAQAQREIALSAGEPPATRGYPPSVFARLPSLVERAGNLNGSGSLSAIYTVLAEGDDQNDPVVDAARAVLDGHIVLSRDIAERGRFPAIDIEASISRVMNRIAADNHRELAMRMRAMSALYSENRDLITIGAYQAGGDQQLDRAVRLRERIEGYMQQDYRQRSSFEESVTELQQIIDDKISFSPAA